MINDLDIVQWEYLLSPEFELINSAGKPLTGGWIEVYLHGTRDKYYCASDFDGTLHPFKIPLDSIGANVVLADPNNAYDVYVYNKFGSLIMSRYNVKCQGSGGSSTYVGDKLYYGQYRASNVTTIANLRRNKGNINITDDGYLKLKSGMSYHITVRGSFTVDDPANEDTTLNYIEYTSVNPIKIDIDETKEGPQYFELSYDIYRLQEDMDYQVAFAQSNGMVTDLIVEVHSLSNLATSAAGGDQEYEAGWGIDITNNVVSVDPSIFEDYTYTAGDYISIDENNVISVTGINPEDFATHDEVHEATVTAIELVTGLIPEAQVQSDWNETDTEDPAYIQNKPDLDIYATRDEVNNVSGKIIETVNNVSGVLHEEVMEVSGSIIHYQGASGINIDGDTISLEDPLYIEAGSGINFTSEGDTITINADPIDLSDYATHDEVNTVSGELVNVVCAVSSVLQDEIDNIPPQVQSDWAQDDDTQVDYIKNKPTETELVAGQNIGLFAEGTTLTICASATDLSDYATHDEVNTVSGQIIETVNNVSGDIIETVNNVSGVLHEEVMEVSGSIIHYQGASGINVEGDTISLEEPLYIEAGSGINFTSEGDTITINADPVDLSDYVTHVELEEAISAVTGIGDYGQFYATDISGAATMARTKGTIDVTNDGKIMLKKGSSYHVTMRGRYNQTTASNTLSTLSLIEYITNNSISVNVDTTITDSQYFEISYDLYKLNSDTNYYVFFNVPAGKINDLFVEIHAIGSVGAGVSGGAGTEYDAGWGIQILNNVISVDPSILNDYTTNGDVYNSTVSAINLVTGMIPEAQVQSDWTEADSADPAYIKNKPEEYNLVAGDNITIDVSGTNIVISSEGGIASGASGCNVEFVNILDYRGQITDREPGAQTTYTGGTALANAMRDIMLRGHIPFLVYGAQFVNSEVFTPIWLDTREFALGTNGGYSCVPLTGHEFFFKNPVTSFVTSKIVIDALNDKISDFIVSADTVATVGRGLTVDYFGAGDPWVWYEGHGPTPPASASTTPGLCRIEIASSIPDVTQVQTMIDTSIAALPITGLPTTELGKFTIQSNVSGGPIEVICPTDQGHPIETVILDNTAVSGSTGSGTSSVYIVYKSPGYDDDYYSAEGSAILHIPEAVTGLATLQLMYAPNSNPVQAGPSFITPQYIYGDSTGGRYVLDAGDYDLTIVANQVPQSPGGYGKYITLQASGPAPDVQALLNSSVSLAVRHPELGITVNLDRYTLGNTNTITNTSSYPQAYVYTDPATKKQSVYLPSSAPYSWNLKTAVFFQYGNSSFGYSNADTSHDYIAYKYNSTTRNYEFAELVHTDYNAKKFTFARTYDGAVEYWIADCTNGYWSAVWSTETIDVTDYIPYSASGIILPNSKFEIDTNGQAYKLISESTETAYSAWNGDGSFAYGNGYTLPTRNADGYGTLKAGTYRFTLPATANSIKLQVTGNTAAAYNGMVIPATNHVADLIITEDLTFIPQTQGYDWITINGYTNSDGTGSMVYIGSDNSSAIYISPPVTEEYLTDGDLELNGSNQVTAIDGHPLAGGGGGGTTYTAGDHISIENDEIAVTGITELVPGDGITITTSGASAIINSIAQDDNIFWAIYGTTTYDEVKAAHTAGKKIVMYDSDGNVVGLTQHDGTDGSTERFYFCWVQKVWQPGGPTLKYAYICKRDGWYRSYTDIQADWNVTNNYYPGYIKNKPTIPNYTGASGIDITNDVVSLDNPIGLVAGNNITIEVSGVSAIISSTGGGGGSSYTAGAGIDITNNEISVDNTVALKTDIPTVPSAGNMLSVTNDTIDVTTTAGITDIQLVNALPASPVSSVLYLIPET